MDRLYGEKILPSNETVKILAGGYTLQKERRAGKLSLIGSTTKTLEKGRKKIEFSIVKELSGCPPKSGPASLG